MMESEMRDRLEDEYDMPVGRLMYHFYWEREMSAGDISNELDVPRQTVVYWLQQSGIRMRSRSLSDTQKVLMIAYLDAGLGDRAIGSRLGCGHATVRRYRDDMIATGQPVDLEAAPTPDDVNTLRDIITEHITEGEE